MQSCEFKARPEQTPDPLQYFKIRGQRREQARFIKGNVHDPRKRLGAQSVPGIFAGQLEKSFHVRQHLAGNF
jgi:hypothetical protein